MGSEDPTELGRKERFNANVGRDICECGLGIGSMGNGSWNGSQDPLQMELSATPWSR